jgi:hypothetical protein
MAKTFSYLTNNQGNKNTQSLWLVELREYHLKKNDN